KQGGLLPAIVPHADTLQALMLRYSDSAALAATLDTGRVTFFSRGRGRRWVQGERSRHHRLLEVVDADCGADAQLVQARQVGPTRHLDRRSCFPAAPSDFLAELDAVIDDRHRTRPADSYTTRLFGDGVRRIAQKVGEEGVETALAAVAQDDSAL